MSTTTFSNECQELFNTTNLYAVLGLAIENTDSLTEKEIKRAYYKCSLKCHPDRATKDASSSTDQVQLATKRFQLIGKVYSILSDSEKRKIYDGSGTVDEDDDGSDDGRDWKAYWRQLFKKVTVKDIEDFKKKYKDSREELDDLKIQYSKYEGDMERVYESAFCADSEEDRDRIRGHIQQLIDQGDLQSFPKFDVKETEAQKKRRLRKAKKEAEEAAQAMKAIMGKEKISEEEFRNAITKRSTERNSSFLQQLEEKYGGSSSNGKKGTAAKKRKVN